MGYRQTWWTDSKDEQLESLLKKTWHIGACFGPMSYDKTNIHWTTQVVHPELLEKFKLLLGWMQDYFVFGWFHLRKEDGDFLYKTKQRQQILDDFPFHVYYLITFSDKDFISPKHRLLFLTILRIAQEFPNVLSRWNPETQFEGILRACHEWFFAGEGKRGPLEGPYTDTNSGHLLINYSTDKIKRWPSIETVLVYLHANPDISIHTLTANILKGNTHNA